MYNENQQQRSQVCQALLGRIGYSHLWTSEGPTAEAKKVLDQYGGPMSNSQWTVFQLVWYVWGRAADVKVQEVLQLPAPLAEIASTLIAALAIGPEAVDAWLGRIEGRRSSLPLRSTRQHHLS
jgi:hypothetical protein